ncbi:MAG TPA: hypothetical protein PKI11_02105 [Candidatus Hydrogenedentes bacterium]|nr:hypothetical protein [Candidatus Hydrogenedentota bacterium]
MVCKIPNLWPELSVAGSPVTPRAILQRQAQVLSERSENTICGEIVSRVLGPDLITTMHVVVPEMEGLRFFVIRVRHNIQYPYPLQVLFSESDNSGKDCASEAEFIELVRELLRTPRIVNMVNSLLTQVGVVVGS